LVVGLGNATVVKEVKVTWPGGRQEVWRDLPVDTYSTLREGSAPKEK
jgi:hypothetical protein